MRGVLVADKYQGDRLQRETVWKMGTGLATAMHFIKTEYAGQTLRVIRLGADRRRVRRRQGTRPDRRGGGDSEKVRQKTMEKIRAVIS